MLAAKHGHVECVAQLLQTPERNVSWTMVRSLGLAVLVASAFGQNDCLRCLLKQRDMVESLLQFPITACTESVLLSVIKTGMMEESLCMLVRKPTDSRQVRKVYVRQLWHQAWMAAAVASAVPAINNNNNNINTLLCLSVLRESVSVPTDNIDPVFVLALKRQHDTALTMLLHPTPRNPKVSSSCFQYMWEISVRDSHLATYATSLLNATLCAPSNILQLLKLALERKNAEAVTAVMGHHCVKMTVEEHAKMSWVAATTGRPQCLHAILSAAERAWSDAKEATRLVDVVHGMRFRGTTSLQSALQTRHETCAVMLLTVLHRAAVPRDALPSLCHELRLAAANGFTTCIELLLLMDNTLHASVDKDGYTPLMLAVRHGDHDSVTTLLQYCTVDDVTVTNDLERNVVHEAALSGSIAVMRCVLQKVTALGAAEIVHRMDQMGNTPAFLAVQHDHSLCLSALLRCTAIQMEVMNSAGESIESVANDGTHVACLRELKRHRGTMEAAPAPAPAPAPMPPSEPSEPAVVKMATQGDHSSVRELKRQRCGGTMQVQVVGVERPHCPFQFVCCKTHRVLDVRDPHRVQPLQHMQLHYLFHNHRYALSDHAKGCCIALVTLLQSSARGPWTIADADVTALWRNMEIAWPTWCENNKHSYMLTEEGHA